METNSAPAAYKRLLPDIMAVQDTGLVHINLDVPLLVTTVLGTLPELRGLRARIASELPQFDLATFDALEFRALALSHAHALFVAATKPTMTLPELIDAATKRRDLLYSDAMALSTRGLLDFAPFKEVKRANGHRALAVDLQVLAAGLQASWDAIQGKTAIRASELEEAAHLADQINYAVGYRDQGPQTVAETASIRHRAFTMLVRAYSDARRAVTYLRWHEEDADTIAPSLFAGRGGPSRKRSEDSAATDAASNVAPAQPTTPVAAPAPAPALPPGFPASTPFIKA